MLSHLERQPRNKERCITWLKSADSLFNGVGLMLLAHFRRIFPLLFQWMHADNNEIIILVLKCTYIILRLTWIRNSTFVAKLKNYPMQFLFQINVALMCLRNRESFTCLCRICIIITIL
ncbi:hypothetical protein JHK82_032086 [Glycine max]|nr:hypothetical protein JHK86_032187 [Glycine max]KAG5125349.1 hypothetical protein JHK82_032086 [Glycine max]KAG5146782.1 hypothetical protein JHK84_032325 [Glycine max]